jgi:hypothetical protein
MERIDAAQPMRELSPHPHQIWSIHGVVIERLRFRALAIDVIENRDGL